MEFGKLENVDNVNWTLPDDDPLSSRFLEQHKRPGQMKIHFGAPAWGHAHWLGKIYPLGTPRSKYLFHYSRYFSCIELNTSHYRIPTAEQVHRWTQEVPSDFLFCPKIFQGISHTRNGLLDQKLAMEWFSFLAALDSNRGPCFLQLPPHFSYAFKAELFSFLRNWPDEFPLALEFRHPSWFDAGKILPPLNQYLQSRGIGTVITDVAGRRDVLHSTISSELSLIRFIGNNLHASDFTRAREWSRRIAQWRAQGLSKIFLFIHEPDDICVPEMTEFFLNCLTEEVGWKHDRQAQPAQTRQLTLTL